MIIRTPLQSILTIVEQPLKHRRQSTTLNIRRSRNEYRNKLRHHVIYQYRTHTTLLFRNHPSPTHLVYVHPLSYAKCGRQHRTTTWKKETGEPDHHRCAPGTPSINLRTSDSLSNSTHPPLCSPESSSFILNSLNRSDLRAPSNPTSRTFTSE